MASLIRTLSRSLCVILLVVMIPLPAVGACSLPPCNAFVPVDGTFRAAASISRFERAAMLVHRLPSLQGAPMFVRREAADLAVELRDYGINPVQVARAGHDGPLPVLDTAWQMLPWRHHPSGSWLEKRFALATAFWTSLSSPILRTESSPTDQPLVLRPLASPVNLMAPWTPPTPGNDFTLSSFDSVVPHHLEIDPSFHLRFAFVPHAAVAAAQPLPPLPPPVLSLTSPPNLKRLAHALPPAVLPLRARPDSVLDSVPLPSLQPLRSSIFEVPATALANAPHWRVQLGYTHSVVSGTDADSLAGPLPQPVMSLLRPGLVLFHQGASATWSSPTRKLMLGIQYDEWAPQDDSELPATLTQNSAFATAQRFRLQNADLHFSYTLDPRLQVRGGYLYSRASETSTLNPNPEAWSGTYERGNPYLGLDYQVARNARLNINFRFYNTPLDIAPSPSFHTAPLNLTDPQLSTEFKVRF